MNDSTSVALTGRRGRFLLFAGPVVAFLGVFAYLIQLRFQRLFFPWYMPVAAWTGVVLVVSSLWKRRTVWRILALMVVLAGFELLPLNAMRLPPYKGPVVVGRPFPAFEVTLSDGNRFSGGDLSGNQHSALVFFRGRW